MIKSNNQLFYPNPFRSRKLETSTNYYELFEQVRQKYKPFLIDKFSDLDIYIDEVGKFKNEARILRYIREKLREKVDLLSEKPLSHYIIQKLKNINNLEGYQKNLKYLDLPLQPLVDKAGFEIQTLSSDFTEHAMEDIEEGYNLVYEYCLNLFPEGIEMLEEYILFDLKPTDFPIVVHDDILEACYGVFDTIFEDFRKNSINLFNWIITGDINARFFNVFKTKIEFTRYSLCYLVLESIASSMILFFIVKYAFSKSYPKFKKTYPLLAISLESFSLEELFNNLIGETKKKFNIKRAKIKRKLYCFFLNLKKANIKMNILYILLQPISTANAE